MLVFPPGCVAPWPPGLGLPQASLAAALRDGGIIAELGYAKEERITNERNKAYPDKAVAAVLSGVSAQASPTTNPPPEAGAAVDDNAGASFEVKSEVKPTTGGEQDEFRVGCIVDIPASPHIPPMRIGEHAFTILLLLGVNTHRVLTKTELCWGAFCCFYQCTLTARQRRLCCLTQQSLALMSHSRRTRMLFSHDMRGCGRLVC